ncbi:alpha-mannosidase 2 [Sipha flava]|uniref:Alpha-mannosidase n=1 Tax=Sipha flava TaxID=143950 RepID=A0A8B8G6F3_9HEMI|nr:alpha-mannosidase 2 [Sipha flava]XP_025418814.1 alpha-mannosidase 2 [Sipha flava]XP_025418815.1 alpha-mannosidase 2 [Sipha flava]
MNFKQRFILLLLFVVLIICFLLYSLLENQNVHSAYETVKTSISRVEKLQFQTRDENFESFVQNIDNVLRKNVPETSSSLVPVLQNNLEDTFLSSGICDPNINTWDLYDKLKFDNIDGGAWKQGWDIQVTKGRWNVNNKLRVFVVPHSHNDPGWKRTFEEYYQSDTKSILDNMVIKLSEDHRRKFIWAEISYLSLWWNDIDQNTKIKVKKLIDNRQLEIVTGGWVMTDEANSHYSSMITQLTNGHQWLMKNLNITANYSWCIDPFGVSPTMPYILNKMQFSSLVIQRTHYNIKKYLAKQKQLEFRWRQHWDTECNSNKNELFTHMMPFYSYDIPHTCGPDPSICCQFDFKMLSMFGLFCPWKVSPIPITLSNVKKRALLLLDQYRKKAELYKTNVLLVPLGDDFRYTSAKEWDSQMNNYQKLFDYLNSNSESLFVEASFGTLRDYFEAVEESSSFKNFPSLTGDFFTYADKDDNYWSGYFTSRPFYKCMDRELVAKLRSAEILYSLVWLSTPLNLTTWLWKPDSELYNYLQAARDAHSLFQHHDGITGTAKNAVVNDYAQKMLDSLTNLNHIIQHCIYFLLYQEKEQYIFDASIKYFEADCSRVYTNSVAQCRVTAFANNQDSQSVIVFNPLTSIIRQEIITLVVANENVKVVNSEGADVSFQIDATCNLLDSLLPTPCFQLHFIVELGPLEIKKYIIINMPTDISTKKYMSKISAYNPKTDAILDPRINIISNGLTEFSLENEKIVASFGRNGLLKNITLKSSGKQYQVLLKFVKYDAAHGPDMSGAYLFMPSGEAIDAHVSEQQPTIYVINGHVLSQVIIQFSNVKHSVIIRHTKDCNDVEIQNLVDIRKEMNYELSMRVTTEVKNNNIFYTDLNGFQMTRRKYYKKLPIQGNFYPMSSAMYIEDDTTRISLLSVQPLGASSLHNGQMEVIQDRRLRQDDNRGLGQGVMDNVPTRTLFRILVEENIGNCQMDLPHLTELGMTSMSTMLYPLTTLLETSKFDHLEDTYITKKLTTLPNDVHLVTASLIIQQSKSAVGLIFHKTQTTQCYGFKKINQNDSNTIDLKPIISSTTENITVYESSLSFVHIGSKVNVNKPQIMEPMELKGYVIKK